MNEAKENFYVVKYTKGHSGDLVQKCEIESDKLPILQKIFNIDPSHPNIVYRKMFSCYKIDKKQAVFLQPHINLKFNLNQYEYQVCGDGKFVDDNIDNALMNTWYFLREFQKSIPWRFIEECKLNVDVDFLRKVFKEENDEFSEPTNYGFEPKINLKVEYAIALQPYISFKFELDKYDYWIEKREEGEEREVGGENEEFIG